MSDCPDRMLTAVVDQASVGWLGRAWDIGHRGGGWRHVHCSGEPGPGWVAGTGLGSTNFNSKGSLQW
ncbi:hypothetical protein AtubIFM61612_010197 [Aspergillus tubingensis]|nr:hypothetical protein AtubIFM61612_010197 [Aspergillus tubingensis]